METPFSKIYNALVNANCNPTQKGDRRWQSLCPVHDDNKASLSLTIARDERILFHCHAGCDPDRIVEVLGLKFRELYPSSNSKNPNSPSSNVHSFPNNNKPNKPSQAGLFNQNHNHNDGNKNQDSNPEKPPEKPTITDIYSYTDPQGNLLFQVCRKSNKDFPQRKPDPNSPGKFIWKVEDELKVPFRLPELIQAVAAGQTIYIPEGEKDVNNLVALGLPATCNPGGAGKWKDKYNQYLRGAARVIIFQDNDTPGKEHAEKIANSLFNIIKEIKVISLPGLPPKGDVSDWLAAGGTLEELNQIIELHPFWMKSDISITNSNPSEQEKQERYNLTDLGNAYRFVRDHGADVRYCHPWKKWYFWNGQKWCEDKIGEIYRRAVATVRSIYAEAALEDDSDRRRAIIKWATDSESHYKLESLISCARNAPGVYVLPEQFNADNWILNCQNGTIDLRTGTLRPHSRADLCTKIINAPYDPEATAPTWLSFLNWAMLNKPDRINCLQTAAGYALTGDTSEQCLFFGYGGGGNGKSTFLNALLDLLGDYAMQAAPELLTVRQNGEDHPTKIAELFGARFVASIEVEDGKRLAESLVKQMTGGDRLKARKMREDFFEFIPTHKLFIAANYKPVIRGTDDGIWRRIHLIPFEAKITPEEKDRALPLKLRMEMSGILTWAVQGCLLWQKNGLMIPEDVSAATSAYRKEMDSIGRFIDEKCITGNSFFVTNKSLYQVYEQWCKDNGEYQLSQKKIGSEVQHRGFTPSKNRGERGWLGIGLLTNEDKGGNLDRLDRLDTTSRSPLYACALKNDTEPVSNLSNLSTLIDLSSFDQIWQDLKKAQ